VRGEAVLAAGALEVVVQEEAVQVAAAELGVEGLAADAERTASPSGQKRTPAFHSDAVLMSSRGDSTAPCLA
jgi:hypothetical protein